MNIRRHTLKPQVGFLVPNPRKRSREDQMVVSKNDEEAREIRKEKAKLLRERLIADGIIKPRDND